jgi:homoserine kinase
MAGVTVRVPGTTANLGSGFDFLGMAVERWLQVWARCVEDRSAPAVALERRGTLRELGAPPDQDLIYRGFTAACRTAGRDVPGRLAFTADSDIPVSRGLGSSSAAVVAGAVAANTLLDLELSPEALLALGTEIEGHPDNVAPAVYGGACLVLHRPAGGLLAVPIEIHAALAFVFAIPDLRVETKRARATLPASVPHATAVQAAAHGAALIHGLVTADPDSLSVGLDDLLHVPYRRSLVTGYDAVTASARAAGAYGATLSGSGPTVVAATTPARAAAVGEAMIRAWGEIKVNAETFVVTRRVGGCDAASPHRS